MGTMLLIPLIPIAALITQNMILLNNIIVKKADLQASDLSVLKSDEQVMYYLTALFDFYIIWHSKGLVLQFLYNTILQLLTLIALV